MYIFILIIHIIVSLVLVVVILLQAGKGGGLADTFGGGGGSQTTIFGQKASMFLTKATTVSAVLFLCTSLTLAFLSGKRKKSLMENVKVQKPIGVPASEASTAPSGGDTSKGALQDTTKDAPDSKSEDAAPYTAAKEASSSR